MHHDLWAYYVASGQITAANVRGLHPVWTYHTGALRSTNHAVPYTDFEATPVLLGDTLYLTTPLDKIIALDAATGAERWTYDPKLADDLLATNYTSRGVAVWQGPAAEAGRPCPQRVFVATLDARLIAVDARTGTLCQDFGDGGQVNLTTGVPTRPDHPYRFYGNTSPATVVGDVAVVGSAIGDNQIVQPEPGYVRGFDVRTGRLLWTWHIMAEALNPHVRAGAANVWSVMAADPQHGLVFVPTSSPSPDFFGGFRPGENRDANSLVALDARSGRKVWAFQLVHHDLWDYDVASEPLLFTLKGVPAVAVAGKVGMLFVLNRLTGEPLFPIEERPVPKTDIPGETSSPTQPFSTLPALTLQTFDVTSLLGHTDADIDECTQRLKGLRNEGVYTPPTVTGSLQFPGSLGGVNWSSMAFDPETSVLYANTNGSAYELRLVAPDTFLHRTLHRRLTWSLLAIAFVLLAVVLRRRSRPAAGGSLAAALAMVLVALVVTEKDHRFLFQRRKMVNSPDAVGEVSPQTGAPYQIFRKVLEDGNGRPCTPTPWGSTVGLDLRQEKKIFQRPLGTMIPGKKTGTVNFGAPIVTAGGLLFTAASREPLLRALDKQTGEELWTAQLPVPAQSTPMTYTLNGKQYVVVDAGGHGGIGTPLGDSVIAYALN